MTHDALLQALNITPEDLAYNQRGELSPRQRAKRHSPIKGCRNLSAGLILVCVAAGIFGLLTPLDEETRKTICINAGMWVVIAGVTFKLSLKETVPPVERVQGKAELQIDYDRNRKHHLLIVDKLDFKTTHDVYMLLQKDTEYIVYYLNTPVGRQIVSIEPASAQKATIP